MLLEQRPLGIDFQWSGPKRLELQECRLLASEARGLACRERSGTKGRYPTDGEELQEFHLPSRLQVWRRSDRYRDFLRDTKEQIQIGESGSLKLRYDRSPLHPW